jgi:hypothetical protein
MAEIERFDIDFIHNSCAHQHLATAGKRLDPCCRIWGTAEVVTIARRGPTAMEPHAHLQRRSVPQSASVSAV